MTLFYSFRRTWILLIPVLLGFLACSKPTAVTQASVAPPVSVAQPIASQVNEWDEFTGRLVSPETVEVRARVPGYIEKVHFKEGGDVTRGDLLFTIDPRPSPTTVDRIKAELGAVRARAELATSEAKRAAGLVSTKAISTDTFETRLKSATEASQAVLATEASLSAAELDLSFTRVTSPISGRISNARVTAGNLVTGGSSATTTLLTTVVSLDPIFCYFDADEASVLRYRQLHREGKRVSALFEPIPAQMGLGNEQGFPHNGTIDFVDNQLNPTTGTIRARAVFTNSDKLMAPGFFARIRIPGNAEYSAFLIRDSAIGSDQGRAFVLIADEHGMATYRAIKTGPIVDGLRVVREGLKESDHVIVSGLMTARPGLVVEPHVVPMATNGAARPSAIVEPKP
jgi:RND family efflux transporter MFP subunit